MAVYSDSNPTGITPTSRWKNSIDIGTAVLALLVATAILWSYWHPRSEAPPGVSVPTEPLSLTGAPTKGSTSARVAVIEFSDFECPFCQRFATDVLPTLEAQYITTGRVLFAFRHYPLTGIHAKAQRAAELASCAGRQGKFWLAHDLLYRAVINLETTRAALLSAGVDHARLEGCLVRDGAAAVHEDVQLAKRLKLVSTPSFLIGTLLGDGTVRVQRSISGTKPLSAFQSDLDAVLKSSK